MKYLLTSVTFLFSIFMLAQDYTPLLEDSKTWDVERIVYIPQGGGPEEHTFFSYYIEGTETFNSEVYFVLKNNSDFEMTHYLREDVDNKRVYEYLLNSDEEIVLFDFNAQVGEVFHCAFKIEDMIFCQDENEVQYVVSDIFYENIMGAERKVFDIDVLNQEGLMHQFSIAEGIGFVESGLFFMGYCYDVPTDFPEYVLLSINAMGIDDKEHFIPKLVFNKASEQIEILNAAEIYHLQIFSVEGQKVLDAKADASIPVLHLKTGVYYYSLSSPTKENTGKIFIY